MLKITEYPCKVKDIDTYNTQPPVLGSILPITGGSSSDGLVNYPKVYTFLKRTKNPVYDSGLKPIYFTPPFESCLIHDKSDKKLTQKHIKTEPKWLTDLLEWTVLSNDGEVIPSGVYRTNEFKQANKLKIRALDKFCSHYQPLYSQKKVTMMFLTFTSANQAKVCWKNMVENIVINYKRQGYPILGYIWTAEVSEKLHFHYHMCIAINRVNFKKIPKQLKFERIWGMRTEIDFVKKNIKHYMAKYFAKHNYRITNTRSYGRSKKFN
jgi:hypothetical protein